MFNRARWISGLALVVACGGSPSSSQETAQLSKLSSASTTEPKKGSGTPEFDASNGGPGTVAHADDDADGADDADDAENANDVHEQDIDDDDDVGEDQADMDQDDDAEDAAGDADDDAAGDADDADDDNGSTCVAHTDDAKKSNDGGSGAAQGKAHCVPAPPAPAASNDPVAP